MRKTIFSAKGNFLCTIEYTKILMSKFILYKGILHQIVHLIALDLSVSHVINTGWWLNLVLERETRRVPWVNPRDIRPCPVYHEENIN